MREAADDDASQCAVLGRSLLALRKVGQRLTVDRIDSTIGYVQGNMQLLAADLNSAKGEDDDVPQHCINIILEKLERVFNDKLSKFPGATRRV
jgi:hypothetical protein